MHSPTFRPGGGEVERWNHRWDTTGLPAAPGAGGSCFCYESPDGERDCEGEVGATWDSSPFGCVVDGARLGLALIRDEIGHSFLSSGPAQRCEMRLRP